jgi:predicted metal-dependent HD superfamily phosphohydrolase
MHRSMISCSFADSNLERHLRYALYAATVRVEYDWCNQGDFTQNPVQWRP